MLRLHIQREYFQNSFHVQLILRRESTRGIWVIYPDPWWMTELWCLGVIVLERNSSFHQRRSPIHHPHGALLSHCCQTSYNTFSREVHTDPFSITWPIKILFDLLKWERWKKWESLLLTSRLIVQCFLELNQAFFQCFYGSWCSCSLSTGLLSFEAEKLFSRSLEFFSKHISFENLELIFWKEKKCFVLWEIYSKCTKYSIFWHALSSFS